MHETSHIQPLSTRPASPLPTQPAPDSSRLVMLWWHVGQFVSRLAREVSWNSLSDADQRRLEAVFELLQGEIHVARTKRKGKAATPVDKPQSTDDTDLRSQLIELGFTGVEADDLLSRYDRQSIERQLDWLPYRFPRNPRGLLRSAIADNWEQPRSLSDKEVK